MSEYRWIKTNVSTLKDLSLPSFTFMTWNILAQKLIKRDLFPYTSKSAIKVGPRTDRIVKEICSRIKPDILCLQELDNLDSIYHKHFKSSGYDYIFTRKDPTRQNSHGLCVLWKSDKFAKIDSAAVRFGDPDATTFGDSKQPHINAGVSQIGQLVALQILRKPTPKVDSDMQHLSTNRFAALSLDDDGSSKHSRECEYEPTQYGVIIGNHHLYWNPYAHFERLREVAQMMQSTDTFRAALQIQNPQLHKSWPLLLGGDFNSTPTDGAFRVFTRQSLSELQLQQLSPNNSYSGIDAGDAQLWLDKTRERFTQWPPLVSAYANYMQVDPEHQVNPNWYAPEMLWPDFHVQQIPVDEQVDLRNADHVAKRTQPPSVVRTVKELLSSDPKKLHWYGEPSFTVYTAWKGTLDYILTQPSESNFLCITHLLALPSVSSCLNALPNETFGSDHLRLAVKISIKQ